MNYTQDEVLDFIKEEDVKFIKLAFFDAFGLQKNISIMPNSLPAAFENGVSFDASAIDGFEGPQKSDLFLHPDPSTITILPWRPSHGRVIRMYCDIKHSGGSPYEKDCRNILKQAVKKAADCGLELIFGSEIEFYLFKLDEKGNPTKEPLDYAGYMDSSPKDKGENIRRNICFTLQDMGITLEASHHEEGPGQNEIDFRYSDPLTAADNCSTFKWAVGSTAAVNGLYADFSPKPLGNASGNGFHINISARRLGNTADGDGGNDFIPQIVAGLLRRIKEMTLFLNPSPESYARLGGGHKAPDYICWGTANRSALIRIPETNGADKRIELRSPDPLANPYTSFALIINAACEGIKEGLVPPESVSADLSRETGFSPSAGNTEPHDFKMPEKLPQSLEEARKIAADSSFIKSIIPESFIDAFSRNYTQDKFHF